VGSEPESEPFREVTDDEVSKASPGVRIIASAPDTPIPEKTEPATHESVI